MAETRSQQESFDSDRQQVGEVYAQALLAAASQHGVVESSLEQLESVCQDVFSELPKLRLLLDSPRIGPADKQRVLDKAFGGQMETILLNFLKVLAEHGRLDCLAAISAAYRELYNESTGRVTLQVTSASEMDQARQAQIAQQLGEKMNKTVEIELTVDPDLIGGTVIRDGDTVYDGSVANRLEQIRQQAMQRTTQQFQEMADRFSTEDDS
jgi:F-type H+-transporting ATPase subunit delta